MSLLLGTLSQSDSTVLSNNYMKRLLALVYVSSSPFRIADTTVSMAMNAYTFDEDSGTVTVCAEIIAPVDGLECDVVATLTLMDGLRASTCKHDLLSCLCINVG